MTRSCVTTLWLFPKCSERSVPTKWTAMACFVLWQFLPIHLEVLRWIYTSLVFHGFVVSIEVFDTGRVNDVHGTARFSCIFWDRRSTEATIPLDTFNGVWELGKGLLVVLVSIVVTTTHCRVRYVERGTGTGNSSLILFDLWSFSFPLFISLILKVAFGDCLDLQFFEKFRGCLQATQHSNTAQHHTCVKSSTWYIIIPKHKWGRHEIALFFQTKWGGVKVWNYSKYPIYI